MNDSDQSWLPVNDVSRFLRIGEKEGSIEILLSPYDIPTKARSYCEDGIIVIEFEYIKIFEKRKAYRTKRNNHVIFELGVKTGRIYKILIEPHENREHNLSFQINDSYSQVDSAIDELISLRQAHQKKTTPYEATKAIFHTLDQKLTKNLESCITN